MDVLIYVFLLLYVDGSMNDNSVFSFLEEYIDFCGLSLNAQGWALDFGGGALCCRPHLPSLTATQGLRGLLAKANN